jgi:hypothetical protein
MREMDRGKVKDNLYKQGALGVVEAFGRVASGITQDPEIKEYYRSLSQRTAPKTLAGTTLRVGGNVLGEGLLYYTGGRFMKSLAGGVAQRVAPQLAGRARGLGAKLMSKIPERFRGVAGAAGEVAGDVVAYSPVDLAITASGPESSVAGAIAELTDSEIAERIAADPGSRFLAEMATGAVGDTAIRLIARGVRLLRSGVAGLAPDELNRPVSELFRGRRQVSDPPLDEMLQLEAGPIITPPPTRELTDEEAFVFAGRQADETRLRRSETEAELARLGLEPSAVKQIEAGAIITPAPARELTDEEAVEFAGRQAEKSRRLRSAAEEIMVRLGLEPPTVRALPAPDVAGGPLIRGPGEVTPDELPTVRPGQGAAELRYAADRDVVREPTVEPRGVHTLDDPAAPGRDLDAAKLRAEEGPPVADSDPVTITPRPDGGVTVVGFHGTRTSGEVATAFGGVHIGTRRAAIKRLADHVAGQVGGLPGAEKLQTIEVKLSNPLGSVENPMFEKDMFQIVNVPRRLAELKAQGVDGVIYQNIVEDRGQISVLAFDPKSTNIRQTTNVSDQVKSYEKESMDLWAAVRRQEEIVAAVETPLTEPRFGRRMVRPGQAELPEGDVVVTRVGGTAVGGGLKETILDELPTVRPGQGARVGGTSAIDAPGLPGKGAAELRRRATYRNQYEKLSDNKLVDKYRNLVRSMVRIEGEAEYRNISFARGRRTQQRDRILEVEDMLRQRGVNPENARAEIYVGMKPSDVSEANRDLLGSLDELSDEAVTQEVRQTVRAWQGDRASTSLNERLAMLHDNIERLGRNVSDEAWDYSTSSGLTGTGLQARGVLALLGGAAAAATGDTSEERLQRGLTGFAVGAGVEAISMRALSKRAKFTARDAAVLGGNEAATRVAASVGTGAEMKSAVTGTLPERLREFGSYLRYKLARVEQPLEVFGREVSGTEKLRDEMASARGTVATAGEHMSERLAPVLKATQAIPRSVNALAKAERGLELVRLGKEATPQQISDWTETVTHLNADPDARQGVDALRAYYRELLDMKLDEGVLSREQYDAIVARGENYVPFVPDDLMEWTGTGWKYAPVRSTGVRRSTGEKVAEAATVDPLDQAILDTYETFARVGKQRVANVIGGIVNTNPEAAAKFITEVTPARKPGGAPVSELDVVETIVNGERRFFRVHDRDLFESWTNFNKSTTSGVVSVLNSARRFMQASITGHPMFGVANGIRDFLISSMAYPLKGGLRGFAGATAAGAGIGAAIDEDRGRGAVRGGLLGATMIGAPNLAAHMTRSLSALNDIMGPKVVGGVAGGMGTWIGQDDDKTLPEFLATVGLGVAIGTGAGAGVGKILPGNKEIYAEFLRGGGGGMGFYAHDKRSAKTLRRALLREGVKPSDFINPRSIWDAVQYVSRAIETAPRLARYKELRAAGEEVPEAVFQARDLSLDFSVKPGSETLATATRVVPFLNPWIQGMDKTARLMADPDAVAVAGATILAPSVSLWMMIQSDPEVARAYNDRPSYERNSHWLIPKKWFTGDDGFWRVPKPFEVGFIYASLPERTLEYLGSKDPEAFAGALRDMYGQFTPEGWPVAVGPIVEASIGEHGYDFWRRREIDPRSWENLPPEFQYDERTSIVGLKAGKLLGKSPAKIDHLIRGITGSLGAEGLNLTTQLAKSLGIDTRVEPMGTGRMFARRFHTSPVATTESELLFRRRWDKADKSYNALEELVTSGKEAEAREYAREHRDDLETYAKMRETEKALRKLSRARGMIREAPLPRDERLESVQRINRAISEMTRATMRANN